MMNEEYNEEEYGPCPHCGATVCVDELGEVDGLVCCRYCHTDLEDELAITNNKDKEND